MPHPREEVEAAYRHYVMTGLVLEDWTAWSQLFTDDATYHDHFWGTFHGPAEIEAFLEGTMSGAPQVYSAMKWYVIDGDRIVYECENRADHPVAGKPAFGFPSLQVITYAGDGKWSSEEDWWVLYDMVRFRNQWNAAVAEPGADTESATKLRREDWGTSVDWARLEPGHEVKPSWFGKDVKPIYSLRDITFGERTPLA